jgi:hypothetical protein
MLLQRLCVIGIFLILIYSLYQKNIHVDSHACANAPGQPIQYVLHCRYRYTDYLTAHCLQNKPKY